MSGRGRFSSRNSRQVCRAIGGLCGTGRKLVEPDITRARIRSLVETDENIVFWNVAPAAVDTSSIRRRRSDPGKILIFYKSLSAIIKGPDTALAVAPEH